MFGASLLAFAALFPCSSAYADWSSVGSTKYYCLTRINNSSFTSSSLQYSPVYAEAALGQVSSNRYLSTSGLTSTTVAYVLIPVQGGNLENGKYFRLNATNFSPRFQCYPTTGTSGMVNVNTPTTNLRYWGLSGASWYQLSLDGNGLFKATRSYTYIAMSWTSPSMAQLNGYDHITWYSADTFGLSVEVADDEPELQQYIQNQTDELKSTDGSSGVMSDISGQGQQIAQNVNFVQQTGQFVNGVFSAFSDADASQGLTFPGLVIMGHEILPQQEVSFLGYLGNDLENTIKSAVTMVLFLAWIMGLRSMYHRIFLGEQEVEVVDE